MAALLRGGNLFCMCAASAWKHSSALAEAALRVQHFDALAVIFASANRTQHWAHWTPRTSLMQLSKQIKECPLPSRPLPTFPFLPLCSLHEEGMGIVFAFRWKIIYYPHWWTERSEVMGDDSGHFNNKQSTEDCVLPSAFFSKQMKKKPL